MRDRPRGATPARRTRVAPSSRRSLRRWRGGWKLLWPNGARFVVGWVMVMIHRHLNSTDWSLMAIESLLERGALDDWREFGRAIRGDRAIAEAALRVCDGPVDEGSAALARTLVFHLYPELRPVDPRTRANRGF